MTAAPSGDARWQWAVAAGLLAAAVTGGVVVAAVADGGTDAGCPAAWVAARGLPAVVTIQAEGPAGAGTGSGSIIRGDGYVLTNDHVISPAGPGGRVSVVFDDGATAVATITGRDPQTDLAVLKVAARPSMPTIRLGSSARLTVGQPVVALGAPLGLSSTVTTGIVSAVGRTVRVPAEDVGTALLAAAIQTDAAINPGNSGGALLDCSARLIGVPTAGATVPDEHGNASGGNIGIGFAIPADSALRIANELISKGSVSHAYLGLQVAPFPSRTAARGGLFIRAATPGGPARMAGLQAGDVLTTVDGVQMNDAEQLEALSLTRSPGDRLHVAFRRGTVSADTTMTVAAQPRASAR